MKTVVLGKLFKLFGIAITVARKFATWQTWEEWGEKYGRTARANVKAIQKSLNKLPSTKRFISAGKWMAEVWNWWLYFLSKREPTILKIGKKFS